MSDPLTREPSSVRLHYAPDIEVVCDTFQEAADFCALVVRQVEPGLGAARHRRAIARLLFRQLHAELRRIELRTHP